MRIMRVDFARALPSSKQCASIIDQHTLDHLSQEIKLLEPAQDQAYTCITNVDIYQNVSRIDSFES